MGKKVTSSSSLRGHAIGMVVLLILQYLLGMFTTLFVSLPNNQPSSKIWSFALSQVPLALHIIVSALLVVGTLTLIVRSFVRRDKVWILASVIGGLTVLEATFAGAIFVPTQRDTYSFVMAISFFIALFSYFGGLYASK